MTIQTCNLKDIDLDLFTKDMGIEEIPTSNLEDMVEVFYKKLISALDHHAPEETKRITKWVTASWFTDEVKSLKKTEKERVHIA